MERAKLQDAELDYELHGAGEPVVLLHWGVGAAWSAPLLAAPALSDGFALLDYHRAGFGGSRPPAAPPTLADHARHCRQLMAHVGMEQAHVVGHSSSAAIALQLALDAPDAVRTLVLMDAARPAPETETQAIFVRTFAAPALERYRAGETGAAVDLFMRGVFGPGYRAALDRGLPGGFEQALLDADAFFGHELPALYAWSFTAEDAGRIAQPVLAVLGAKSPPTFVERRRLLLSWLPAAEPFELPGAGHLLHVENPDGMAAALAAFFARHTAGPSAAAGAGPSAAAGAAPGKPRA
jgi:pimeloyl-ACP methyl ester carboxylesterase